MTDKPVIRYNAIFQKNGDMVYISHLDLMTLFRRAIRRADLPFVLTGGFTSRVKISMPQALKLGKESDREEMSFWLTEEMDGEKLVDAINRELPDGVRVLEIRR